MLVRNDHAAWLMWGIPFATTPIGACFFGSLADRWGRKVSDSVPLIPSVPSTC